MRGAGGTEGGIGRFFIGLIMLIAGGYLFFNNIQIATAYRLGGFGAGAFRSFGGFSTSGYVLVPFVFGIGMVFYSVKNIIGWLLVVASLVMLGFGVVTSVSFHLVRMSAFDLITILVLMIGGLGLFLSSLRDLSR